MADTNDLSERELEILRLVATGAGNKQIAQQLGISTNTVKVHLRNIFAKIGVVSRTEAAMYAVQSGLVPGITTIPDFTEIDSPETSTGPIEISTIIPSPSQVIRNELSANFRLIALVILGMVIGISIFIWSRLRVNPINSGGSGISTVGTPVASCWKTHAKMPVPRYGFGVSVYENLIYVIAGSTRSGVTNSTDLYNPELDSWTSLSPKPTAAGDIGAAVIGGKIYLPGGRLASGSMTDIMEIYDIQGDRWEKGTSLPKAISGYSLVAYEGRLYLFGGWDGQNYLNSVLAYDPDERKWAELTPMPTRRAFSGAVVAGGRIFVIGGRNQDGELNVNEVFSPDLETPNGPWSTAASMPEGRSGMGVASVADIVHVAGGMATASGAHTMFVYRPSSDTWGKLDVTFPQTVTYLGLAPLEGSIFALGGKTGEEIEAVNQSCQAFYFISIPLVR